MHLKNSDLPSWQDHPPPVLPVLFRLEGLKFRSALKKATNLNVVTLGACSLTQSFGGCCGGGGGGIFLCVAAPNSILHGHCMPFNLPCSQAQVSIVVILLGIFLIDTNAMY